MGNEVEKKNTNKKSENIKKLILCFACLIVIGLVVGSIVTLFKSDDIKSVKRILKNKYYNVECLDSYCNSIMAEEGNKLKTSKSWRKCIVNKMILQLGKRDLGHLSYSKLYRP